jgi:hypothetical protein
LAPTSSDLTTTTHTIPKKATTSSVLQTLDTNQGDEALLREARNQKRKAISPEPQDQELDQEINNLEAIHQQLEKRREKVLCLYELQKKIDEATEKCATLKRRTRTTTRTKITRASTKTIFIMNQSTSNISSMTDLPC